MMSEETLKAQFARQFEIQEELVTKNPGLPAITAMVMAGDLASAERILDGVRDGTVDPTKGVWLIGSYARLGSAMTMLDEKLLSEGWLARHLPELWRSSDPDDTDARFLRLWRRAWIDNGFQTVCDGDPLPGHSWGPIEVFRGQRPHDPLGFAWTTDEEIARSFAEGASFRTRVAGKVISGLARRDVVFAYLTGRGESEVIVDPRHVMVR